jgi:3-phosphoshikimate 1-carboxyvinyltransferase
LQQEFMQKFIKPLKLRGMVKAPPSKSYMQRALFAAAMAEGLTEILNPTWCDDALAALNVIQSLGAKVESSEKCVLVGPSGAPKSHELDCGESGLCLRMSCALAGLFPGEFKLTGRGSLLDRPVSMIEAPLRSLGVAVGTAAGKCPVVIRGPLKGGTLEVDGALSSQFISGLLMALPLAPQDSKLRVTNLKSRPYVAMTLELLKHFGAKIEANLELSEFKISGRQHYCAGAYTVEGDWSGGSFLLVAAALNGPLLVEGLRQDSLQADRAVLEALEAAGAALESSAQGITVKGGRLRAFEFDAGQCPDLFPPLTVLALGCSGESVIHGAGRLQHKESDRAKVLVEEFSRVGGRLSCAGDCLKVTGGKLAGGQINSHNDHRIAMAGAVAALNSDNGIAIDDCECVAKSYPRFFEVLSNLQGET